MLGEVVFHVFNPSSPQLNPDLIVNVGFLQKNPRMGLFFPTLLIWDREGGTLFVGPDDVA